MNRATLPNERGDLYNTMKNTIVQIEAGRGRDLCISCGVFIDARRLVLTSRTNYVSNDYFVRTCAGETLMYSKFKEDKNLGLLLLKPQFECKPSNLTYAKLANSVPYDCNEVHCISRPEKLSYSCKSGKISYLNRPVMTIEDKKIRKNLVMGEDQKLNQVFGLYGNHSSHGAPVFDNQGRIVGIYAFSACEFDFLFTLDSLHRFIHSVFQSLDGCGSCDKEESSRAKKDAGGKGKRKMNERSK